MGMNLAEVLSKITEDFLDEKEKELLEKLREEGNYIATYMQMIDRTNEGEAMGIIKRAKYFLTELHRTVKNILAKGKEIYTKERDEKMAKECDKAMEEWKNIYSKNYLMLDSFLETAERTEQEMFEE